jgi:hypothetical protein
MPTIQSSGTCLHCGREQLKSAMSRHLASCARRERGPEERIALLVEGVWAPAYWLHLELKSEATLTDVDAFLRHTWLECCGHMSSFEIGDRRFDSGLDDFDPDDGETMDVAVGEVLRPGGVARYVYDFGSSTELRIRALAPRSGKPAAEPVRLVARNAEPRLPCNRGHADAVHVCAGCGDAVCEACTPRHRCGPEMLLPVVNSPRVGVCAYGT